MSYVDRTQPERFHTAPADELVQLNDLPVSELSLRLAQQSYVPWEVHNEGVRRKDAGEDIILLSTGDPDFDTPDYITSGVVKALQVHRTHYSEAQGERALRQTLADLESKETDRRIGPENFTIFNGATGALYGVLSCIANLGDNVVMAEPNYVGYAYTFNAVGVEIKLVPTKPPTFDVDVDELIAAVDSRTAAVLVNTPCNPTGNMLSANQLSRLSQLCRDRGIWLISDEVYSLLSFEEPHISLLKVARSLDNVIVIDGLSKSHAMSGWRVGWTASSRALSKRLVQFGIGAFFSHNQFVQDGARYALERNSAQIEYMREQYRKRRDFVLARINNMPGLSAYKPKAAIYVLVHVGSDGDKVARELLDHGVTVIQGSASGDSTRDYIRIALNQDLKTIEKAMIRIEGWATQRA